MRGTPQKQQSRPFRDVRSLPGSHFQGPLDFLDFWPPKAAEMKRNPTKAAKAIASGYIRDRTKSFLLLIT